MKVKQVKNRGALTCLKNDISFNTTKIAYVANEDGTQGLMSKVEGQKVYVANSKGEWIEC